MRSRGQIAYVDIHDREPGRHGAGSGLEGDLRYAINKANINPDLSNRILFQPGLAGTLTLRQGELTIDKSVTIEGPGLIS